jgi:hypothetical protein
MGVLGPQSYCSQGITRIHLFVEVGGGLKHAGTGPGTFQTHLDRLQARTGLLNVSGERSPSVVGDSHGCPKGWVAGERHLLRHCPDAVSVVGADLLGSLHEGRLRETRLAGELLHGFIVKRVGIVDHSEPIAL